jgi:hypothetical protein
VWTGAAFDCKNSNNMIVLVQRPSSNSTGDTSIQQECNDGSIVAHSFRVDNISDVIYYTSRLNVKINPNIAGKNISCLLDDGTILSPIGSITVTQKGNHCA